MIYIQQMIELQRLVEGHHSWRAVVNRPTGGALGASHSDELKP